MGKDVLGLFEDEGELRDYLARNLNLIEVGLSFLKINYPLVNVNGAGGSLDILAKDQFGNFVIIEIKRSNQSARQALHELSKYIALFLEDQKVELRKIRCFVVSTEWHELDVPLSFFRDNSPVDVKGFLVSTINNRVVVESRELPVVSSESRLSPDLRFCFFDNKDLMDEYCKELVSALSGVALARAALLTMEPIGSLEYMCLLCTWRIPDFAVNEVERLVYDPNFKEEHYHFKGWELETDLADWLLSQSDKSSWVFAEDARATPEKIENYKRQYNYTRLVQLGAWPKIDLVNDLQEVLRCLVAKDSSSATCRSNRHDFDASSSKITGKSWGYTCAAFKAFMRHNQLWVNNFNEFEKSIPMDALVTFKASDVRHFYYALHQTVEFPKAELSQFAVDVTKNSGDVLSLYGGWLWDGVTFPSGAKGNIERDYEEVSHAIFKLFSAVDQDRYEYVYENHGFYPYALMYDHAVNSYTVFVSDRAPNSVDIGLTVGRFVLSNFAYCSEVSSCFSSVPRNTE